MISKSGRSIRMDKKADEREFTTYRDARDTTAAVLSSI
jgi:hypothetical protein